MNNIFDIQYIKKFPFVKVNKRSLFQIIIISLCAGIAGFVFETLLVYISKGVLVDRGFLCGPFLPIYALVAVLSLIYIKTTKPSFKNFIKLFFIFGGGITLLEFIVGNLFELLVGVELWDYDGMLPLSYKYVSLSVLGMWGLLGSFCFLYVVPLAKRKVERIPHRIYPSIIIIFLSLLFIDLVITVTRVVNNKGEYVPLYNINSSLQLTFFMIGLVVYIIAAIILGKFIYRNTIFIKKIFIVIYVIILFIPVFSVVDYLNRFEIEFLSSLASIGFIILAIYLYFLMTLIIFLLIKKIFSSFINNQFIKHKRMKRYSIYLSLIVSLLTSIIGIYNVRNPVVNHYKIGEGQNHIKIALISDVHYGTTGYDVDLEKMVNMINNCNTDVVFLLGDIIDSPIKKIDITYFVNNMNNIVSKYGVYAITGNHELNYNSLDQIKKLYSKTNVRLLLDESVVINNEILVIGRIDKSYNNRLSLDQITNNNSYPMIVLDHQPSLYKESFNIGAMLQLSGHTHNGQLFPMDIIVKLQGLLISDVPIGSGLYTKNNFNLLITKGFGVWGFPLRTTGRSEIIISDFYY